MQRKAKRLEKKLLQLLAHGGYTMWPNEGAASKPNEDSQAEKSYQGCKENKKIGCEKMKKIFFDSLLTTAASDFKKINSEVLGNHNKMNTFFFLRRF